MTEGRGLRAKMRKGIWLIAFMIIPVLVSAGNFPIIPKHEPLVINKGLLEQMTVQPQPAAGNAAEASEIARIIAREEGLPAKLVHSLIQAESNGDAKAVSRKGAMGLMQLMPGTAKDYQVADPFDPEANIRGGVRYLKDLLEEFAGNLTLALAAYNAGPEAVRKYQGIPPFPETQAFVRKVQDRYQEEMDTPAYLVFASKSQEITTSDKGLGKIIVSGSPRDVAAFMKFLRKDKPEVRNR
jgi:soluble lytic murein transglycosylase-like protein